MTKPPLTLQEQVQRLHERGFTTGDDTSALTLTLYSHSYYRLSGYWRYFQNAPHQGDNNFHTGIDIDKVLAVYRFDTVLRNILLEGICDFEVVLRSRLGYHLATDTSDEFTYLRAATYRDETHLDGVEMRVSLMGLLRVPVTLLLRPRTRPLWS